MSQSLDIYDNYFWAYSRQILEVVGPSVITVILNSFRSKIGSVLSSYEIRSL